jgi:hypothetical protein
MSWRLCAEEFSNRNNLGVITDDVSNHSAIDINRPFFDEYYS